MSDPHRLPAVAKPQHYDLRLAPDLEEERFEGSVGIDLTITEPTSTLVCNAADLDISKAVVVAGDTPIAPKVSIDEAAERVTLELDRELAPGESARVEIDFAGKFNPQLVGFYLSRFTDSEGNESKLATTQFEATHARNAFPCWDEPAYKATFSIALEIDPNHEAVSNAAELGRETLPNGRTAVQFAPTMVMSTYLVAFVVGPLAISEPVDVDGTPLRVVHVPGKEHLTSFALDVGAFGLRYLSDYFDIGYPGDKCDLVAIPDFAFGAMENLGCVTFREVLLLIDPDAATPPELQRAADVIFHELAHMWFGDLVTMAWWNGLWLKEAFATFMELRCTDAYRPEWQRWVDFGLSRTEAFDTDSLASTRPIEFTVESPADAEAMFDVLTYEKGASVVRMLEQHLGEERFQAAVRSYMNANAYGNADNRRPVGRDRGQHR